MVIAEQKKPSRQQVEKVAGKLRKQLAQLDRITGGGSERAYDATRKRDKRARERDIVIPSIVNRQRRLDKEQDDAEWMRYYFPEVFFNEFSVDQRQSLEEVASAIRYGTKKCIAGPRGDGKTAITRYRLTKGLLSKQDSGKPECPFALYVGASDIKAHESDQAIRYGLRTGARNEQGDDRVFVPRTPLGEDYPFECAVLSYVQKAPSRANNVTTNGGWKIHVQWANNLIMPSLEYGDEDEAWEKWMIKPGVIGAMLVASGITGSVLQGANILDKRPSAVVLDDLDNRESLAADQRKIRNDGSVAEKIGEIIDKTIAGMRGQGRSMGQVMLCTVTTRKSVAFRYSDPEKEPSWSGVRKKRIKQWPSREREEKEEQSEADQIPTPMERWEEYMTLRRRGMQKKNDLGDTVDPHGREAHRYYLDHFEEMNRGAVLGNHHVHDETNLPDGTKIQETTLQWCFDFIADVSMEAFLTEYQQEPPEDEDERLESQLTQYHIAESVRDMERQVVSKGTEVISAGIDVRKTELHDVHLGESPEHRYQVSDYGVKEHAPQEITEEMAEAAILEGLRRLADRYDEITFIDEDGLVVPRGVTLIDKGWLGNWKDEDGSKKYWATQPVETFCVEKGLRHWMPAKGQPEYKSPAAGKGVIVGPHWHINLGPGKSSGAARACDEVIWDTMHYRMEIEKAFQTDDPVNRLWLFTPRDGYHTGHRLWIQHMLNGVKGLVEQRRGRKPKWRKDHWWDSLAMAMVAQSVEKVMVERRNRKKPSRSLAEMEAAARR